MYYIAWISKEYFMQTKHLCALIYIRINGEDGTVKHFLVLLYIFYLSFQSGVSFVDQFCYLCFTFVFVMLHCLFLAAL